MSALDSLPRWLRHPTLRTRLTLTYGGAFALAGVALVTTLYLLLASAVERQPTDTLGLAVATSAVGTLADVQFAPTTPMGTLVPSTGSEPLSLDAVRADVAQITADANAETLRTMLGWSVVALLLTLVLAVGFGWLMASRVLAPLHTVTATARRVADTNLHERISLSGPDDEIKDLADTFDAMLERLDRSFDGQRRFAANASHELRTPLTITRTVLEVAADDPDAGEATRALSATLLAVNERQEQLIEGLLTLASADQTLPAVRPVDLEAVTRQVLADVAPAARAAHVGVRFVYLPAGHTVHGDPVLLDRLVRNLVDNAVRYNHTGGSVVVTLDTDGLTVENTGPVVPASQAEGLFEPFRRLAADGTVADRSRGQSRRGVGLGLSIVRSIAVAHSGEARADAREGGGLVVRVRLAQSCETRTTILPTLSPRIMARNASTALSSPSTTVSS